MPDAPNPEQIVLALRARLEPSEGYYAMVRRVLDGLACMIEQNEFISDQLRQLNEPAEK